MSQSSCSSASSSCILSSSSTTNARLEKSTARRRPQTARKSTGFGPNIIRKVPQCTPAFSPLKSRRSSTSSGISSAPERHPSPIGSIQPVQLEPQAPKALPPAWERFDPLRKRANLLEERMKRDLERPVQYGIGRGKGGLKKIARSIRRQERTSRELTFKKLRVLRQFQQSGRLEIPAIQLIRVIREILSKYRPGMKIKGGAIELIREYTEKGFLLPLFEDSSMCAAHGRRVTLMPRDLDLAKRILRFKSNADEYQTYNSTRG